MVLLCRRRDGYSMMKQAGPTSYYASAAYGRRTPRAYRACGVAFHQQARAPLLTMTHACHIHYLLRHLYQRTRRANGGTLRHNEL